MYDISTDTSFNSFSDSMTTLIQLFMGDGWHEVMYANILATGFEYSYYFIIYIVIIGLLIINVFTSLILSSMAHNKNIKKKDNLHNQCYNADFNTFHKEYNQHLQKLNQQKDDIELQIIKLQLLYQRRNNLKNTQIINQRQKNQKKQTGKQSNKRYQQT